VSKLNQVISQRVFRVSLGPGSSGKTIPEEKYRAVFKRMFADLGLPPEKLDELKFKYTGGDYR